MLLEKLELLGFKSFANKVEIRFDKGITAIIGPNGSGKSNIAEAMRWVLGEQSARNLRGARMEDIIFSGTQTKRPLAYAEVQITLTNEDKLLPVEYSEVSVTRRVYRSGESEYFINRVQCRLRDIVDLFRDTGIGKEGYSVIGQGRIDDILSNKSEDRRAVFEEAAGISKFRARKDEANRKLESTRDNLVRIGDIVDDLQERIEPLFEQSEVARQYLKLREELKDIELNAFLHQYERANVRIKAQDDAIAELSARIEAAQGKAGELSDEAESQSDAARSADSSISARQHVLLELTKKVEQQDGEGKVLLERMESLLREAKSASTDACNETSRAEEFEADARRATEEAEELAVRSGEATRAVAEGEAVLLARTAELSGREEALEREKERMMDAINRLSNAKVQSSRFETMLETITEREAETNSGLEKARRDCEEIARDKLAADAEERAILENKERAAKLKDAAAERKSRASARLAATAAKEQQAGREAASLRSRQRLLIEMKNNYEGYYSGVRKLLVDTGKGVVGAGVLGVVAQLISVPAGLEKPVEFALGTALQNIVTTDEAAAKRAIEHLRRNDYGRATFLPLTAIKTRVLTADERRHLKADGCLGVASELVTADAKFKPVLEHLLGRTVVTKDMDAGLSIARASGNAFRIVTLMGDIISTGGSITGGSLQKKDSGLLGREREIADIGEKLNAIAEETRRIAESAKEAQSEIEAADDELFACEESLHGIDIELAHHFEKTETVNHLQKQFEQALEAKLDEAARLKETKADIEQKLAEMLSTAASLESFSNVSGTDVAKASEEIARLRAEREELTKSVNDLKMAELSLKKEHSALCERAARIMSDAKNARNAAQAAHARERDAKARMDELSCMSQTSDAGVREMRARAELMLDEIRAEEQKRDRLLKHAKSLDEQAEAARREAADATDAMHRAELVKGKTEVELSTVQNRVWEEYELTYEGALAYKKDVSFTSSQRQTDQIRREIRALGDVNVNAIEDYKNVKERYDNLYEQQQDLLKAEKDLTVLIDELMAIMRRQFKAQFARINKFFGETFTELFGGGTAELRLVGDDVLTCDIDIIAQPPGKKLQLLSLLSGGERALTAIALLFSVLKHKPMPFCVLDEIEASLDEANVDNFANYLRRYSDGTQFILITHRKGSMEVSDTLYGVAMEERGVSKLISVRLADSVGMDDAAGGSDAEKPAE